METNKQKWVYSYKYSLNYAKTQKPTLAAQDLRASVNFVGCHFLFTVLTHLLRRHSPLLPLPSVSPSLPSSQLGIDFILIPFPLLVGVSTSELISSPYSYFISYTHRSPSVSTSTPVMIRSSTHSRDQRSSAHFFSLHSHPLGGWTSSKKRVPFGLEFWIREEESGSCGEALKSHDSHSFAEDRCCSSKISTSLVSGAESKIISFAIQESSHDFAFSSWGWTCSWCVASIWRWMVGWPSPVIVQPITRKIKRHGMR